MSDSRMRIVEVFNRYAFYGGEEKIADWIADDLAQRHEVKRCGFHSKEWMGADAPGKLGQVRRLFYNSDSRKRFDAVVKEFRPEVALFHNVYPVGSPSLYHAAKLAGVPVVQYVHNFRPFSVGGSLFVKGELVEGSMGGRMWPEVKRGAWQGSVLKSALMALALKRLLRSGWLDQVKVWVCISDFMRQQFAKAGVPEERLVVLKHPAEMNDVGEPTGEGGSGYLFLGRLVEDKGVRVLLQAWDVLREQLGERTPELMIGGEGPLEGEVRAGSERNEYVRYAGMLGGDAKGEALRRCRALVVPSVWWEPLGLVVYEAYAAGKPVLAAASGGLTETVMEGGTGLLHAPGDAGALAESVMRMEEMSDEVRREWGSAGREWLKMNAGVGMWEREMDGILERVVGGSGQ